MVAQLNQAPASMNQPAAIWTGNMTEQDKGTSIFISYAWGEGFEKKEWVRRSIVASLDWRHDVFWDRDNIAFGEMITGAIRKALTNRPLMVICLCD